MSRRYENQADGLLDKDVTENLGRSVDLLPSGPDLQVGWQRVVQVNGDDPKSRTLTTAISVQYPRDGDNNPRWGIGFNESNPRILARIKWGSGGRQHECICDVLEGIVLTVHCSFLIVEVKDAQNLPAPDEIKPPINVGGNVGYDSRATFVSPTFTDRTAALAAAGTFRSFVPPMARTVSVFANPATLSTSFQDFQNVNIVTIAGNLSEITIPGRTASLLVTNTGAVPIDLAIIYEISL